MLQGIGISLSSGHTESYTEVELRLTLMNAAAGGHVTRRERLIMENVLDLESKSARRYMMPRHHIVYINRHDSMEEKLRIAADSGHTRFPLCDEDMDHIIGIVHIKDVFKAMINEGEFTSFAEVAREPLFCLKRLSWMRCSVNFNDATRSLPSWWMNMVWCLV
jgi:CBS domain containing-hemolysin-like protein